MKNFSKEDAFSGLATGALVGAGFIVATKITEVTVEGITRLSRWSGNTIKGFIASRKKPKDDK